MYLKFDDGYCDSDLEFLRDLCTLFDTRMDDLQERIDKCFDPDQMGLFDEGEYLAGLGFVACQQYLTSTFGPKGAQKHAALGLEPYHEGGESYARILNSAANYWKHVDEWSLNTVVHRDISSLSDQQKETIRVIETVTPWCDYTCGNLLYELTQRGRFVELIPTLEAWRAQVDVAFNEPARVGEGSPVQRT